jgi:WD40 repeat protein
MSAAVDRTIKIYSIATFDLLDSYAFPSPVLSISVDPSSPRFLIASMMEGSVHLIDLVKREVIQKLKDHNKYVVRSAFSDDGKWLATAGYDKVINLYEVIRTESTEEAHALLDGEEEDELSSTST